MIHSVVDDWLDIEFCKHLAHHILYSINHTYGHTSNKGDAIQFYHTEFNKEIFHIKYMCRKIAQEVVKKECGFLRAYANIQFPGMDGTMHVDDGDMTAIYMVTKTLDPGDGVFEYIEDDHLESIDFVQNRIILFEGNKHRALAPKGTDPRVTVAFKIMKKEDSNG
jgi:hypothetical protein